MPKAVEKKLKKEAKKKGLSKEASNRYIFGTMKKIEKKKNVRSKTR